MGLGLGRLGRRLHGPGRHRAGARVLQHRRGVQREDRRRQLDQRRHGHAWNQICVALAAGGQPPRVPRRMRRQQIDSTSGEKIYQRLRDNPLPADIDSGDALNVILDQVNDPRVHSSALRMGTAEVPGAAIQQIPFVNASEAVSFSIHQLAAKDDWPVALRGDAFADLARPISRRPPRRSRRTSWGRSSPRPWRSCAAWPHESGPSSSNRRRKTRGTVSRPRTTSRR